MLAHHLKEVLTLVPEAMDFVKQASLELDFPTDSKDSVAASYLAAAYLVKSAGKVIDPATLAKLEKAASLYGIKDQLDQYVPRFNKPMVKQASEEDLGMVKQAEAFFDGELSGFLNQAHAVEAAEGLLEKFAEKVTSEEVKRYGGKAWMCKEAACYALANRHVATKGKVPQFMKIAHLIEDSGMREDAFEDIHEIAKAVMWLDKEAGLDLIGMNFFKEALITKEAAVAKGLQVKLAGVDVPYTKVAAMGKSTMESFLGKEACAGLTGDAVGDKYHLESLPQGLQKQLRSVLR